MEREADVFVTGEDQAYNRLLAGLFRGGKVAAETVQYVRRPGNAYDRQYEKFRRPRGTHPETHSQDEEYRLGLAEVIVQKRLAELRKAVPGAASAATWSALYGGAGGAAIGRLAACGGGVPAGSGSGVRERRAVAVAGGVAARPGRVMRMPWTLSLRRCGFGRRTPTPTPGRRRRWRRWAAATRPRSATDGLCSCVPTTARRRPGWALLLAEAGRLDEATGLLRRAVELKPTDAAVHQNLGVALAQQGKAEEAARRWKRRCDCGRTMRRRSTTSATCFRGWADATRRWVSTGRLCGCGRSTARRSTTWACC